jgi:hypothetical protein
LTIKSLPRYRPSVFAFVGDSTMSNDLGIQFLPGNRL